MSVFKCTCCNYETYDKSNFSKHNNSKKHREKVTHQTNDTNKILNRHTNDTNSTKKCDYCNETYSTASSLARHKKACSEKHNLEEKYKQQIAELTMEVKHRDDKLEMLQTENTHLKSLVSDAGSIVKSSVSTLQYVVKHYNDAPALTCLKNYAALKYDQNNTDFVEELISHYNHKLLGDYLGDFIVKTYKKEDPAKQSLWNSDTSRLTYLIRDIVTKKKVDWTVDKKGIKTTKYIIEPVLEYVEKLMTAYIDADACYDMLNVKESKNIMMKIAKAAAIRELIRDKTLAEEILRYISPHFFLEKTADNIKKLK